MEENEKVFNEHRAEINRIVAALDQAPDPEAPDPEAPRAPAPPSPTPAENAEYDRLVEEDEGFLSNPPLHWFENKEERDDYIASMGPVPKDANRSIHYQRPGTSGQRPPTVSLNLRSPLCLLKGGGGGGGGDKG